MIFKLAKHALIAVALATVALPALPALAQRTSRVEFQRGRSNTTLSGTITGREYADYVLRARAGQTMSVALTVDGTNGDGSVFFNILPPGSRGEAIFNGSTSPNRSGQVRLPQDGDYTIRVYLMGNDRDAGKTVGYNVSVSITGSGNTGNQPGGTTSGSDALVPGTNYNATGIIPCSMGGGQPTTSCRIGVLRHGNGNGTVTVAKPDGRTHIIFFQNGRAVGYDQHPVSPGGAFSAERQSDLSIIRIGPERYEIPDAVIFGG